MKFTTTLAFLALGLSVLLSGCNSVDKSGGISVTVVDLKPLDASLLETQVLMTLRYTSESLNPVGFSGSSHKLYFNGAYIGRAVSHTPLGLPPLSTTTRDVTLVIENAALVKQVLAMQGRATASYRLESVLFLTSGDTDLKVKTDSEGTLDLRGLQSAQ
jgi:LEA14-like dessication related protein